jgi:hypothetical protein
MNASGARFDTLGWAAQVRGLRPEQPTSAGRRATGPVRVRAHAAGHWAGNCARCSGSLAHCRPATSRSGPGDRGVLAVAFHLQRTRSSRTATLLASVDGRSTCFRVRLGPGALSAIPQR